MMNKIEKMIADLEEKSCHDEKDEKKLEILRRKQEELGESPSDVEVDIAMRAFINEYFRYVIHQKGQHINSDEEANTDDNAPDNTDEPIIFSDIGNAIQVVRSVFHNMDLRFRDFQNEDVHIFELGIRDHGKNLRVKIYLEAELEMCRIEASYPFIVDREIAYPLCEKLAEENYCRRYSALQYDARDGELSCRYSFPIMHGLHDDEFLMAFLVVTTDAFKSYDAVKQYANGRFRKDRQMIIERAQALISEME